ncbi:VOC family protein [Burkholderia vietnamiensis]|uniref:VOC family protein n=1 Tax=Burkholderia vietnamiensis TaxID=60552 RepID=UPI001D15049D|nr:VOC family protein [Burkholderia vietnamiensis]UEC01789.1 VOC family protein [Burkholderia vietnamiensis]
MNTPFKQVHHICIVVRDIEKTVAYYESLGIGPWENMDLSGYTTVEWPHGKERFFGLTYKRCDVGTLQIQLCQPGIEETREKQFLDTKGEGVYHIGFVVSDIDIAEAQGVALNLPILARARRDDQSGYTYFDNAAQAGVVLELRQSPSHS